MEEQSALGNAAAQDAEARSNLYGLLGRVFRAEVDAVLLRELRTPAVAGALRAAAGVDMATLLPGGDDQGLLDDMAREYCRLFLLGFSPHESVQRGEGQLWGNYTTEVQELMDELGLAPSGERSLVPDHLAIELEIMQHLTEAEANAISVAGPDDPTVTAVRNRQQAFLRDHLMKWVPAFLGTIERSAQQPFYAAVANLAVGFLASEHQEFGSS